MKIDNPDMIHESFCNAEEPCNCKFRMTLEETKAVIKELGQTFIDRDNPLCNEVLNRMIKFVGQYEQS